MRKIIVYCILIFFFSGLAHASSVGAAQDQVVEFVYTEQEQEELNKWKGEGLGPLLGAVNNNDRAGLYLLGLSALTGSTGLPINREHADVFFDGSASFGFGPSIKHILYKYLEEENIFLVAVYCNLLIASGHQEYVLQYHALTDELNTHFGIGVIKEIERLAMVKHDRVRTNQNNKDNAFDDNQFFIPIPITIEDSDLNNEYWLSLAKMRIKK